MTNESEEYGYADIPPKGAHGRTNPPKERKAESERPVYEVDSNNARTEMPSGEKVNFTVLAVAGLLVLAILGAYFYQTESGNATRSEIAVPTKASEAVSVTGDKAAVRIELVRTIDLLSQIELKLVDNPAELAEVGKLIDQAKSLIDSMEE